MFETTSEEEDQQILAYCRAAVRARYGGALIGRKTRRVGLDGPFEVVEERFSDPDPSVETRMGQKRFARIVAWLQQRAEDDPSLRRELEELLPADPA